MKKSLLILMKSLVSVLLLMAVISFTGAVITPLFGIDLSHIPMPDKQKVFMGLFTVAIVQTLILALIAHRSKLKKKNLGLMLSAIYFAINHVLNTIESLIFMRNIYPVSLQLVELLNGLIIALVIGFAVAYLWGGSEENQEEIPAFHWSKKLILSWTGWIIIWFVIYFCAGFLIPMNVEGVSEYYFSSEGAMDMSLVPIGYLMQIPRASIWILLAIALQKYLRGSIWEKSLITGITFGCLMSSFLLVPNYLMPGFVRMAHLPEILYANLLWGVIISWKVNRHFTNEARKPRL
ncbi:MAG: hypothetical protein PF518_02245 [Spirochaetaceae bacterium]|jgi:hypothetical protein|nr:hypothetical protein [Spirochaetaceae bacterium]